MVIVRGDPAMFICAWSLYDAARPCSSASAAVPDRGPEQPAPACAPSAEAEQRSPGHSRAGGPTPRPTCEVLPLTPAVCRPDGFEPRPPSPLSSEAALPANPQSDSRSHPEWQPPFHLVFGKSRRNTRNPGPGAQLKSRHWRPNSQSLCASRPGASSVARSASRSPRNSPCEALLPGPSPTSFERSFPQRFPAPPSASEMHGTTAHPSWLLCRP
mmetsp:Transcript_21174/g.46691  ORF Transcript_21174/g.46691 Transcript_21174/m.46691 type:complete len:214 (-) Transcript_21174:1452-2093(-)